MNGMRWAAGSFVVLAALGVGGARRAAFAQGYPAAPASAPANETAEAPLPLEWTPPVLTQLDAQANSRTSFTLDRSMLTAAAGMSGPVDDDTRRAINHLDGVSVHLLRFSDLNSADPVLVDELRDGYHLSGWMHVVSTGKGGDAGSRTDVWTVMQGTSLRAAVVLVETPANLTLATVTGNLSPLDLLHLRGHFGIPRFDAERLQHEH